MKPYDNVFVQIGKGLEPGFIVSEDETYENVVYVQTDRGVVKFDKSEVIHPPDIQQGEKAYLLVEVDVESVSVSPDGVEYEIRASTDEYLHHSYTLSVRREQLQKMSLLK